MRIRLQILWFFIFVSACLMGQNQANNWYFGQNAGINFNTNPPSPLNNGALISTEGAASISSANGTLLFYTNGQTVWDSKHKPMQNGTGLLGSANTTQSSLIVPYPKSKNKFFIFTLDDLGGPNGLNYSVVDMSLNGGLGAVSTKNTSLQTSLTEKLTGIRHGNGTDYWVLVHGNNNKQFTAYQITDNGVSTTTVTSTIGSTHPNILGTIGYMKFSPDGKKVACAVGGGANFVEIFDFNDITGELSNTMRLDFSSSPYGIEFSPDSKRLYVSNDKTIFQYTLPNTPNVGLLTSTEKTIVSDAAIWGLQLAPNKKIYACKQGKKLAVINSPNNVVGSENFQDNIFTLTNSAIQGLPNLLQNYFNDNFIAVENTCMQQPASFNVYLNDVDSIHWDFGDNTFTSAINPTHTYMQAGAYLVKATIFADAFSTTYTKNIVIESLPSFSLGNDTVLCKGEFLNYNFTIPEAKYIWNNGQLSSTRKITTPGVHFLDVTVKGCTVRDSININYEIVAADFDVNNATQCFAKNSFDFSSKAPSSTSIWKVDDNYYREGNTANISFTATGKYTIKHIALSKNGCADSATQDIKVNPNPKAAFSVTAHNTCGKNNSFTFTNTTAYTNSYTLTYIIDGKAITNQNIVNWTFANEGEHTVLAIVNTAEGCDDTTQQKVTVYSAPNANFNITEISNCINNNAFDISFEGVLKSTETLTWYIDGKLHTPASNKFSQQFATTGIHTISAEIANTSGCKSTVDKTIEVFENPVADFATLANTYTCLGANGILFKSEATGNLPISQYLWDFGDNTNATTANPTKTYTAQAQFPVTLTVTNSKGCLGTVTKNITTYEPPKIAITTQTISACEEKNAFVLSFTNSNAAASISQITWQSSGGNSIPAQNNAPVSFTSAGTYTVTLEVETPFGCKDAATTNVSVYPSPTGNLVVSTTKQCADDNSFNISAPTSHNSISISQYTWDIGTASGSTNNNITTLNYTTEGDYDISVNLLDENGCKATLYTTLNVYPTPTFEIQKAKSCEDEPINITISNLSPFVVVNLWDWELGDGSFSNQASPIIAYKNPGSYALKATATTDKGCTYTAYLNNGVEVAPKPITDFEYKKVSWGFAETVLEFTASTSLPNNTFEWDFGNGKTSDEVTPQIKFTDAGYYLVQLKATSEKGCVGSTTKNILIVPPFDAYVPSSFTPNGDGINDYFGMEGVEFIASFEMNIYSRWGQNIFTSNNVKKQWDGKYGTTAMPSAIYTYSIKITDTEGRPYKLTGTIYLIR